MLIKKLIQLIAITFFAWCKKANVRFRGRVRGSHQWRFTAFRSAFNAEFIDTTRAGERLMKAAGSYSSLVETRLVYDRNMDQLKRGP